MENRRGSGDGRFTNNTLGEDVYYAARVNGTCTARTTDGRRNVKRVVLLNVIYTRYFGREIRFLSGKCKLDDTVLLFYTRPYTLLAVRRK